VDTQHNGKDLVVQAPVEKDATYVLVVDYSGTPEPADAPTTRSDFNTTGWTVTGDGEVWTMQEPYGAYTWYPVNDQPSDKAFYDFTITAPGDWVGIANGQLQSRETVDGDTVTEWSLDAPAASYLTTIAIGDYVMTEDESASGVPLTYWTPADDAASLDAVRFTPQALAWNEKKLGTYPFASLGILVVDSESGMETQTMITLGDTDYTTSPEVLVHEITHQWYGDVVTPTDWRDVWMNEGMTMYLQGQFEADRSGQPVDDVMDTWASAEPGMRAESGPPGNYDPTTFGQGNIYYGPALMWHELRKKLGDDRFWAMVKKWPSVNRLGNATREQYLGWIEKETGEELTAFFDAWLLGEETPPRS
jgi:aminopeptidase N